MIKTKLSLKRDPRRRLIANLATSALLYGKITTTQTKAKAIKSYIDKIFSLVKINNLSAKRAVGKKLFDKKAVQKLFELAASNIKNSHGSLVSIYRIGNRLGDGAMMAQLKIKDSVFKLKTPQSGPDLDDKQKLNEQKDKIKNKNVH